MKNQLLALTLVAAGAALAVPAPLASQSGDFRWSGNVPQGQTIEIRGVMGDVRAVPSRDGTVRVEAARSARRDDPQSVHIEVVEHAGGVTICAVYPTARGARRENACRPGGGNQSSERSDVRVDFTVQVPAGVEFAGSTVSGDVVGEGLRSDVRVSSVNGSVRVGTSGVAQASTVNGSVTLRMGPGPLPARTRISSVNGPVTLELPELNAELRASTVNGHIESDFPIVMQGRISARSWRGTIGAGGPELHISTVNGPITLRRVH
jgi:hypothetical protein